MKGMSTEDFCNLAEKFHFHIRSWDKPGAREIEMFTTNRRGHKLLIARLYELSQYCSFIGRTANDGEAIGWSLFTGYKRNFKNELVLYDLETYSGTEEFDTQEDFENFLHKQLKTIADFNKEIKKQELIETSNLYEI